MHRGLNSYQKVYDECIVSNLFSEIFADHILPSHMGREGKGHLAERRVKSQRSSQSNLIGRPVREPANDAGVLNEKMISKVLTCFNGTINQINRVIIY